MQLLSSANAWFERTPVPLRVAVLAPLIILAIMLGIAFFPIVWIATLFGPRSARWSGKQVVASLAAWALVWLVGVSVVRGSTDWITPGSITAPTQSADHGYTAEDRAFLKQHGVAPADARAAEMAICRGGRDC